jgi:phospholipase C
MFPLVNQPGMSDRDVRGMAVMGRKRHSMFFPLTMLYVVALALLPVMTPDGARAATSADEHQPKTPIKHFISLMQENHSFDNYFGTYPGADGVPAGTCMPIDPNDPSNTDCIKPYHIGNKAIEDLDHTSNTHQQEYNNGQMNGFISAFRQQGKDGKQSMGYYDDRDLPFYWNIADQYVLFDRFFSSAAGGSVRNHMFWVAGQAGATELKDSIPTDGWGDIPTIFDRLQESGVSWKFYIQNYKPEVTYRDRGTGDSAAQVVWCPLLDYARFLDDPELNSHIVNLEEYFTDLENNTLPSVSYIVPSGASEHPPGSILAGQRFVKKLLNSLMESDSWQSSAFMWSYDDWGGWYDHVPPPDVGEFGYGFRVPALLVSPYAKKGYIDHTQLDFTSMLKFIQYNWTIEPLANRDANAQNFLDAFDFKSGPRQAGIIEATRPVPPPPPPRRNVIYAAYVFAIIVPAFVISIAVASGRYRLRRRAPWILKRRGGLA